MFDRSLFLGSWLFIPLVCLVALILSAVVFRLSVRWLNLQLVKKQPAPELIQEPTVVSAMGDLLFCLIANFMIIIVAYQFTSNSLATIEAAKPFFPVIWIAFAAWGYLVLSMLLALLLPERFKRALLVLLCSYVPSVFVGIAVVFLSFVVRLFVGI